MARQPKSAPEVLARRPPAIPRWLRGVKLHRLRAVLAALALGDLEELLAAARVELGLAWTEPTAAVFTQIANVARAEWDRLGRTTDDALLVAYELARLVPAFKECLEQRRFRWLNAGLEKSVGREQEFELLVRKRRGPPRRDEGVPSMFAVLRSRGYDYAGAVRGAAVSFGLTDAAVEQRLKRNMIKVGKLKSPCPCREPYPYCPSCNTWLPKKPRELQRQKASHVACGRALETRAVEEVQLVCPDDGARMVLHRPSPNSARCPKCGGERRQRVARPLPHAHCVVCDRPFAMSGPPLLVPVGPKMWACNDLGSTRGCLARARERLPQTGTKSRHERVREGVREVEKAQRSPRAKRPRPRRSTRAP